MNDAQQGRLLVTVAHPDDETFACGSLLLAAAAAGAATFVCCATRGEAGEPAAGSGVERADLAQVREQELRSAAAILGVSEVMLLGYRDSGMDGAAAEGTLAAAAPLQVAAELTAVIDRVQPQIVVTLDASDGHRDHAVIRDSTVVAVEQASWSVDRVYLHCLSRELLREWADSMREVNPDSPYLDVDELGLGTPDAEITDLLLTSMHLDTRRRAIAAHASQTSPFAGVPPALAEQFLTVERLKQVVPPAPGMDSGDPFAPLRDTPWSGSCIHPAGAHRI